MSGAPLCSGSIPRAYTTLEELLAGEAALPAD